jgi:hypothetical protein
MPWSVASMRLKFIQEMDKEEQEKIEKIKKNKKPLSSIPKSTPKPKPGHIRIPSVSSIKISR